MTKFVAYSASFLMAWAFMFAILASLLGFSFLVIAFISWSWPQITILTWGAVRFLIAASAVFSIFWLFSDQNKDWVQSVIDDIEAKK